MALLVSCRHCKRAVLMIGEDVRAEVAFLRDHLAVCRPGDFAEDALRHFRSVAIEGLETPATEYAVRTV